jgi:hypothetical protein
MTTKKKPTKKREPREDFNQAAFRIVQEATREKQSRKTANVLESVAREAPAKVRR